MDHDSLREPGPGRTFTGYINVLLRVMPGRVAFGLLLTVLHGLTEGAGVVLLVPLLQLVGLDVQQGAVGRFSDLISSLFMTVGIRPTLASVLGVFTLVIAVQALLLRKQTIVSQTLEHRLTAHLRRRLYRALLDSSWSFFTRSRSSDFVHVLTEEVNRVGRATYFLMSLVASSVVTAVYLTLALRLSAAVTLLVLGSAGVLLIVLRHAVRRARDKGEGLSLASSQLYGAIVEHVSGMKVVKSYGAEPRIIEVFGTLTDRIADRHLEAVHSYAAVKGWFDIGAVVILSFTVYWSFTALEVSSAGVLLLIALFARIIPRVSGLQQSLHHLVHALPAFDRVTAMQRRCEASRERRGAGSTALQLRRDVRFEGVSFGYEGAERPPVLVGVDLVVRAGETTAIVGPSGAGKSTLADLVMGLLEPTAGKIVVDGTPLDAETVDAWRSQIGYVAQDTFLFHDTVRANLLWARPQASAAEMREALRLAAAADFVSALPEGLDAVVGDRGVRISGGERQRLALARALLRKPSLLILDEATSHLDAGNERRIQEAIDGLHGRITILTITHRLSAVRGADTIYVLDERRIVETGAWDELFGRREGRFRALCDAQGIGALTPSTTARGPRR